MEKMGGGRDGRKGEDAGPLESLTVDYLNSDCLQQQHMCQKNNR